jgi:hypothetical protein
VECMFPFHHWGYFCYYNYCGYCCYHHFRC